MLNEVKRENLRIQMTTTEENLQRIPVLDLKKNGDHHWPTKKQGRHINN